MIERATVTAPEMIGLLAWWIVMLAAPVLLVRRWRRRVNAAQRLRGQPHTARRPGRAVTQSPVRSSMSGQAGELSAPFSPIPNSDAPVCRSASGLSAAAAFVAAGSQARRSGTALPTPRRLRSGMLEPLCRYVDFHHRLELAASELERRLTALPQDRWRIEPYPLTGERGNTLLVLGETGVYVISATYAPGHWDDVVAVSGLARKIELLLPGYPVTVRPAICHPFSTQPARDLAPGGRSRRLGRCVVGRWRLGDRVARALRSRARRESG